MDCAETRTLLDAYIDSELDLTSCALVDQHLQACAECRSRYEEMLLMRQALSGLRNYDPVPASSRRRIRAGIRREALKLSAAPAIVWRWAGSVALVAAAAILLVLAARNAFQPSTDEPVAEELIQSHVRSLMADHLTDVASSDQHTVKPWFNGKIDFSPDVRDFTSEGYPLVGGRLDYAGGAPAAVLVYRRHAHVINLFIMRAGGPVIDGKPRQGFNIISWRGHGMMFYAVSDLNRAELETFEQLFRR